MSGENLEQMVPWDDHDCVFEEDHDGGMTCPVCGRYEEDHEQMRGEDLP